MPTPKTLLPLLLIPLLGLSACTWVKTDPGAERVQVRSSDQVRQCERLGQTTASVRDRVAAVQRRPGRVEEELETLARNSAVDLGGDTIVAEGPVRDGQRRYSVWRCAGR